MGCDGYLYNLHRPKNLDITCYDSGKRINLANPLDHHEDCVDEINGKTVLRLEINFDDYEAR